MQCQKIKTYMETGRVVFLPVKSIETNPDQPRQIFTEESLSELAESIRRHGILQPLSVRRTATGYQLIAGERRLRAGMQAGLTEVPCLLMRLDDQESGAISLVENLQRQDLSYIETAQGIQALMARYGMSQEQVARLLGKSQSAIANKLRLLQHSRPVLEQLRQTGLTERHARALLKLRDDVQKLQAIGVIARLSMSVARAEQYIESLLERQPTAQKKANIKTFLNGISKALGRIQQSGIPAISERRETGDSIVLTITIPK